MQIKNLFALGVSSLALMIGSSACSASNDAYEAHGDHEATGENASAGSTFKIPQLPRLDPQDVLCGHYYLEDIVLAPNYDCPDVPAPGGRLHGIPGHSWLVVHGMGTTSEIMSRNPWLTMPMVLQEQPFCAYDYVSDVPLPPGTLMSTYSWDNRDLLGPTTYPGCGVYTIFLQPEHTPCAGCNSTIPIVPPDAPPPDPVSP